MNGKRIMTVGLLALTLGCVTAPRLVTGKYEGAAAKVAPRHVIFVGWDGFAGNTFEQAKVPTLRTLMAEGAWTLHSRSILPSSSACNWRSVFTCSAPEQHGYVAWDSAKPAFPVAATAENGLYPDLFHTLRRQRPSAEIGILYTWSGIGAVADTNACDFVAMVPHADITDRAVAYIKAKKPTFLAVCYDYPDHVGHVGGWGSPSYYTCVTELDAMLRRILDAAAEAGILEDAVVLISSDHGGTGKDHGGPTLAEMERPVVLWGKAVKRGYELAFPGTIYDTGATLAALLGLNPPAPWIGRPFDEAFVTP